MNDSQMLKMNYAGFWIRTTAALIDTIALLILIGPMLIAVFGVDSLTSGSLRHGFLGLLINYCLPAVVVIVFWLYRSATPGKMICKLTIVDADTGGKPTPLRLVVRYIGYYISVFPLMAGIIWVAFDSRKQGWHDKLARTVVVRNR